ncbi:hypothetical protein PG988_003002 [Apiospora saccharicola]
MKRKRSEYVPPKRTTVEYAPEIKLNAWQASGDRVDHFVQDKVIWRSAVPERERERERENFGVVVVIQFRVILGKEREELRPVHLALLQLLEVAFSILFDIDCVVDCINVLSQLRQGLILPFLKWSVLFYGSDQTPPGGEPDHRRGTRQIRGHNRRKDDIDCLKDEDKVIRQDLEALQKYVKDLDERTPKGSSVHLSTIEYKLRKMEPGVEEFRKHLTELSEIMLGITKKLKGISKKTDVARKVIKELYEEELKKGKYSSLSAVDDLNTVFVSELDSVISRRSCHVVMTGSSQALPPSEGLPTPARQAD